MAAGPTGRRDVITARRSTAATLAQRASTAIPQALDKIGRDASLALYRELTLAPKPGLVSFRDSGSHTDMDAHPFVRSIFALRSYFPAIANAGANAAPFAELEALGIRAELRMLAGTAGINTHRGAIFTLGLLCAAAGRLIATGQAIGPETLRAKLDEHWGDALRERAARAAAAPARSAGQRAARSCGLRSASDEAAEGFPVLFEVTLPALRAARPLVDDPAHALVHALFATIAVLDDTNLAHRGGIEGLRDAQSQASEFLAAGSVFRGHWRARADAVHQSFVARRLSPGGAADMIACAWWLHAVSCP